MKSNTINQKEINKFSKIAKEWWDPEGKFAPLHRFNPIRIKYIKDSVINHYNIRNKHLQQKTTGLRRSPRSNKCLVEVSCCRLFAFLWRHNHLLASRLVDSLL